MKKWMRSLTAVVLCVLVLAAAMPSARGAAVYFSAVNDSLQPLESGTMPTIQGGVLYVPYTMLSATVTGVNLGVYSTYSSVKRSVLVYSNRKQLTFDLQNDTTYDGDGRVYSERAIVRNSIVYIPIARVCDVFSSEIYYSLSAAGDGNYLVRIKGKSGGNPPALESDESFISAAYNMMQSYLVRYRQDNPDPEPDDSAAPTTPSISGSGAGVYLGVIVPETGEETEPLLAALSGQSCQGLFFFTAEQLAQRDELVRRLLATGHFIGLRLESARADDIAEELALAEENLSAAAHCRLTAVLADGLDEDGVNGLRQAGYACWLTTEDGRTLTGSSGTRASTLIRHFTRGELARNYLLLDASAGETLPSVLAALGRADFQFRAPVAPAL